MRIDKVDRKQLAGFLVEANRWLKNCLQAMLGAGQFYFVLFDDLDRGYDPDDKADADRLVGLLLAARDVFIWADELGFMVGPVVFLRSDIYDGLTFPDKKQVTQNLVEVLTWTDEMHGENSLKALIDQRIKALV